MVSNRVSFNASRDMIDETDNDHGDDDDKPSETSFSDDKRVSEDSKSQDICSLPDGQEVEINFGQTTVIPASAKRQKRRGRTAEDRAKGGEKEDVTKRWSSVREKFKEHLVEHNRTRKESQHCWIIDDQPMIAQCRACKIRIPATGYTQESRKEWVSLACFGVQAATLTGHQRRVKLSAELHSRERKKKLEELEKKLAEDERITHFTKEEEEGPDGTQAHVCVFCTKHFTLTAANRCRAESRDCPGKPPVNDPKLEEYRRKEREKHAKIRAKQKEEVARKERLVGGTARTAPSSSSSSGIVAAVPASPAPRPAKKRRTEGRSAPAARL